MDRCENTRSVTVFGRQQSTKTAILFNPRCKTWACDYCAEINKDYWIHQAGRGALIITSEGRDLQFITLTSRGYATPNKSLYFFKKNWPKLRKRMSDRTNAWTETHGIKWAYFMVPERHQSGVLHAHMVAATHISSEKIWKDAAYQTGFGYVLDVQEMVNPLLVSRYISKYLNKGIGAEVWPDGFRRVRHSQNWPMTKPEPLPGWWWQTYKKEETVWLEKNALLDMGWRVIDKREE